MSYTLGEAAKAAGFSKPTLSRAIKNGKLSAKRLDDGSYSIDAAELERWKDANGHRNGAVKRIATPSKTPETPSETSALQAEVEKLRAQAQSDQRERGFLEGVCCRRGRNPTLRSDTGSCPLQGSVNCRP